VKAFWAQSGSNFGDVLTPLLFERLAGIRLEWAPAEEADLFAVGSIIEIIPRGYTGLVVGSGCWYDAPVELDQARVLALRGVLTARLAGLRPPLLADLGLLAPDLLDRQPERDLPVGTVRAGGDPRPPAGVDLRPDSDALTLIATAARCQTIVSSSLHGLILADALGIPNMWDPYPTSPAFKFRDYASAYGERIEPYTWRVADQVQVGEKQRALRDVMADVTAQVAA
jgi:pyruvyltransferase